MPEAETLPQEIAENIACLCRRLSENRNACRRLSENRNALLGELMK